MKIIRPIAITDSKLISNVPENDYPIWTPTATFALGGRCIDTTRHRVYESLKDNNKGNPITDLLWWVDAGPTNRWKMFDQSPTSQTSQANSVSISVETGTRIDSVVGLNCDASSVSVSLKDATEGTVYSKKISLTSYSGITDWYEYFYQPIERVQDFIIDDIPSRYPNATLSISIDSPNSTVYVGGIIVGLSKELGFSEWGAKTGIVDYSVKTRDAWGNYQITPRPFSKRVDLTVQVETNRVDDIQNTLAKYRSTPIVYVGSNDKSKQKFASTLIYGFYKEFSISIAYNAFSVCSMQIEGLT